MISIKSIQNSAYSCGNLIYLGTLKCAHSFFARNLQQNFKWDPIEFSKIRWGEQRVFSHMLEPYARRHKGIAEYLKMTNTHQLYYNNLNFKMLIDESPVLDSHSMSYHDTYGNYAWLIDWIPLSKDYDQNIELTNRLLLSNGIKLVDKWDYTLINRGSVDKKQLVEDLKIGWENRREKSLYSQLYLERDKVLYQKVISKFNLTGDNWNETSWLRDRLVDI
jgi:hypothetical protein